MFNNRIVQWLIVGALMLPIAVHMFAARYTRLLADDYCYESITAAQGWLGATMYWHNSWQGTFTSNGLQSLTTLLDPQLLWYLPSFLLLLWWISVVWTVYQVCLITGTQNRLFIALFTASLTIFVTLESLPNIFQAVYWISGVIRYVPPLIMMTFYIGFVLYSYRTAKTSVMSVIFSVVVMFIVGGFTPVFALLQLTLLGLAISAVWILLPTKRQPIFAILVAGLVGAVIALIIMLAAPGNAIRQANFPPTPALPTLVMMNLQFTLSFIAIGIAIFSPLSILMTLIFSAFVSHRLQPLTSSQLAFFKRRSRHLLLISSAIGFVILYAIFLSGTYSVSAFLPARALIIPQFILILLVVVWGVVMGLSLQNPGQRESTFDRKILMAFTAIFLLIIPVRSAYHTLNTAGELRTFAAEWDARDSEIRAAAAEGVTQLEFPHYSVDLANYVEVDALGSTPHTGFNVCAEDYYGIEALTFH